MVVQILTPITLQVRLKSNSDPFHLHVIINGRTNNSDSDSFNRYKNIYVTLTKRDKSPSPPQMLRTQDQLVSAWYFG